MKELIIKHFKKNDINFGKEGYMCDYVDDSFTSMIEVITDICKEYHKEQLRIGGVIVSSCCKGMGFIDLPNGENCYCACEKGKEQRSQQYEL